MPVRSKSRAAVLGVSGCIAWQEQCLPEYQHPEAAALHPGFYQLCVQLLQTKSNCCPHLSASLCVPLQAAAARREAKPTVSSAAAGFLPPHSCIPLFLAVPPSKSKNIQ